MTRIEYPPLLTGLVLGAFVVRVVSALFFADPSSEFYSEYGEIAKNLHAGKGYSLFHKQGEAIDLWFTSEPDPFPSAFMPPGYTLFLYLLFWIADIPIRNAILIAVQSLTAAVSLPILYTITKSRFGRDAGFVAVGIAGFLPEFVYATILPGPVVFYHAGVLMILNYLDKFGSPKKSTPLILGLLMGSVILLRSEFIVFVLVVLLLETIRGSYWKVLFTGGIVVVLIAPWAIRNSFALETFVPLSTNAGLNLYRGHNPVGIGEWGDDEIARQLAQLQPDVDFEVRMQELFLKRAMVQIETHPIESLGNGFIKLYHLWVMNPSDERSFHPLYLYPSLILLVLFVIGSRSDPSWTRHRFLHVFLIFSSLVAFVFFALPRYQTMMKIVMIPFVAHGLIQSVSSIRARFLRNRRA